MADLVIGHESLGEVVEVGANVTRVKVGDLVVPMVRRPCPHDYCMACRASRQDFCFTGDFTERGIKEQHGFMAQFVVDDEKYMNLVPTDSARHRRARRAAHHRGKRFGPGLEHPATACLGAARSAPGKAQAHCHKAVVLGAGPVGLLGAMALVNADFDTYVYAREPAPNPKSAVLELIGAQYLSAETHSLEAIRGGNRQHRLGLRSHRRVAPGLRHDAISRHQRHLYFHRRSRPQRAGGSRHRPDDAQSGAQEPGGLRHRQRRTRHLRNCDP